MRPPRIQIWTGNVGGHNRIAQALAWGLAEQQPDVQIQMVDIYSPTLVNRRFSRTANSYDRFVARAPWLWGVAFYASRPRPVVRLLRAASSRLTRHSALSELLEQPPDVLVSVIPDVGQLGAVPRVMHKRPPVIMVVSDLVSIHRAWLSPQADLVLAPTEPAMAAFRSYKLPSHKLQLVGYPMRSALFCPPGLPTRQPPHGPLKILFMGGSSGSGRMLNHIEQLMTTGLKLEITAVCGKNTRLQRQLAQLAATSAPGMKLNVLGYTDQIPQLMQLADVLISKAGPSTVFEAIACQLPVILTAHLPGQEGGNAEFFEREGVALRASSPHETARIVASFVADPRRLERLRQPALAEQTCQATPKIAAIILRAATEGVRAVQSRGT
jgi:UDP-N-acetylglucosamine:LPS N-acetylglucosamine transferase